MQIEKYSFGTGDRFGRQGHAQLRAITEINRLGIPVVPVWNKSNREHTIIGSAPADVREEAASAVAACGYSGNYYVDADHISLETVDKFIDNSTFFTVDVAHCIGRKPPREALADFKARNAKYQGSINIHGMAQELYITGGFLEGFAENYLVALEEVRRIYDHISAIKGRENFIAEVSVDEAEKVQGPLDLFFILSELKVKGVEVQTIAPKFTGLFAKGVDYYGDVEGFEREFERDVAVVRHAIGELGMPVNLKLSVHSGSDKFSIYPAIRAAIRKFDTGIHVKTAGTTWLEEVIGLAEAGEDGLEIACEIYARSLGRFEELTRPYATVLNIKRQFLPEVAEVNSWNGRHFSEVLTHDPACKAYNPHFRQLIHVGYKIAAEMGDQFLAALDRHQEIIANKVAFNLLERHLKPLFL